ncbi:MAG TPA: NYN domain-containing protein [Brevefilum sp.]|nr:NYN domain-containing protein [Brevefilum sp.]HOR19649.1 NYN domain-containing protein [Brevefilum sp.]HPL70061.1 NYN domain-containing protein [Brevefilum sp.]
MEIIIDGHNLIPHIPGIDLSDADDELRLISTLQEYCRVRRAKAVVFFDGAPIGQARVQQFGRVTAHFVRVGMSADAAIMDYLQKLGKQAKNVAVVSSDRQIVRAARAVQAKVITSADFAAEWANLAQDEPGPDPRDQPLSAQEVDYWEKIFKQGREPKRGKPYK